MRRIVFDLELKKLNKTIEDMGDLVNTAVKTSVKAFLKHDVDLAQEVVESDVAINRLEARIEKASFTVIALQQPVASDLRQVVSIMRAANDLERIGDHAVSVAKAVMQVKDSQRIEEIENMVSDMSDIVENMMKRVVKAYVNLDTNEARQIAESDGAVDAYFQKITSACIQTIKDGSSVTGGMEYAFVASYLERIGDYITNLCERIVYVNTGRLTELN